MAACRKFIVAFFSKVYACLQHLTAGGSCSSIPVLGIILRSSAPDREVISEVLYAGVLYGIHANGSHLHAALIKHFPQELQFEAIREVIYSDAATCSVPHAVIRLLGFCDVADTGAVLIAYEQPRHSLEMYLTSDKGEALRLFAHEWVRRATSFAVLLLVPYHMCIMALSHQVHLYYEFRYDVST
jgi:hypothetical protein